jgi:Concanavalin A-like lectin/glucanases superfamily/Secretion system C-terminal sorting domain
VKKHYKSLIVFLLITTISFSQIPSYVPSNGLVGWWPFNGTANDESGNGNNGTVNGATLTVDRFGVADKAYSFNANQKIGVMMNNFPVYSVSVWAKINTWSQGGNIPGGTLVSHKSDALYGNGWAVEHNQNQWCWLEYNSGNSIQEFSGVPQLNTWFHVVLTSDSSGLRNLYVNGNLIDTYSGGQVITGGNLYEFKIGAHIDGPTIWWFIGSLDDVGYWNRALTVCEIQNLYASQVLNANINAGPDQTICRGDLVTLQGSGGSSLAWDNGVINGVPFEPAQSGAYVLTGADSLGCIGTDTVQVTVLENASSTINQTAIDSYTLNGQTYTQSGTYTQVVPAANGCDSVITLNLELDFTGIQSHTNTSLQLYPNPVKDVMTLVGLKGQAVSFAVYSVDGKLIKSGQTSGVIQLEDLKKGNYILKIENEALPFVKL